MFSPSCTYSFSERSRSTSIRFWFIISWSTLFLKIFKCQRRGLPRYGRTYKCSSRICKKACRYEIVIHETCLCESAWTMGQFVWIFLNIFANIEKFQTRNITYYAIQKNQSSSGEHSNSSLHFILFIRSSRFWKLFTNISGKWAYDSHALS